MKKFYVYQLRLENCDQPFYIGKGTGSRASSHLSESSMKGRSHKNNVIRKAVASGVNVLVEILHDGLTDEEALEKEVELIAFYGRRVNGGCLTNATDGGDGASGYRHTEDAKKRISEFRTGRKAPGCGMGGKTHKPETKAQMSKIRTGKIQTETHKTAIKHGQWDKNPAWMKADAIFDAWISANRPGWKALAKITGCNVESMHRKFLTGWNPREDATWGSYIAIRH